MWKVLKATYPKADSYALTVGSTLCAIGMNLRKGDALAARLIGQLITQNPERWEEAQGVFRTYFKQRLDSPDDLYAFLDKVSKASSQTVK